MPVHFPPVEQADSNGILAIGGNLNVETLTSAYCQGIFPWPISNELPLTWFAPNPRGILETGQLHISRSLQRFLNKTNFSVCFNRDFEQVIQMCAEIRKNEKDGTWINQEILQGYIQLFKHQLAYCVSVYENEKLVGGIYGVCIGEIITGESMFFTKTNASKMALVTLAQHLRNKGIAWIDTQMVTPIVASFGGKEIPRKLFMQKLSLLDRNRSRFDIFGS